MALVARPLTLADLDARALPVAVGRYNEGRSSMDAFHARGINRTDLAIEALWPRVA